MERRDLLDENPEARAVIDQVMAVANATGKDVQSVYRNQFREIAEKISQPMDSEPKKANTYKPSFRGVDEPSEPDIQKRNYEKLMAQAKSERNPVRKKDLMEEALHTKLFKK